MDSKTSRGFALLPTYGRVTTNVPRFFKAAKTTGMTIPGYLVVDEADYVKHNEAYDALELPDNWTVHLVKGGSCAVAVEEARRDLMEDNTDWLMLLQDDLIPETPGWDVKVVEALNGWNIASTNDGREAPKKFTGAMAWSGDAIRALGFLYLPGTEHFFIDTAWEELALLMNNWTCLVDVMVRHARAAWTPDAADATTSRSHLAWTHDEPIFIRWQNHQRIPAAERLGQLLVQYGAASPLPDLSDVHVMVATPCGKGEYVRVFVNSLYATIDLLHQCKAKVNFIELPYCADVAAARIKLLGQFLRSDATHMLSIDDDMGWKPQDVVRLFTHNRDFVAVAGPRKTFPMTFACQKATETGAGLPLTIEGTGLVEVTDVGFAFALVKRAVFQRVVDAHPELDYSGDDGRVEHGVFCPLVAHRRYKSEDYAFCHRYRALGGKIYVDPSISLQHVGTHTWEGRWLDELVERLNKQLRLAA